MEMKLIIRFSNVGEIDPLKVKNAVYFKNTEIRFYKKTCYFS